MLDLIVSAVSAEIPNVRQPPIAFLGRTVYPKVFGSNAPPPEYRDRMRSPAAEYALRCEEKASTSQGRSPCRTNPRCSSCGKRENAHTNAGRQKLEECTVPGVIRITIAAKGRYFFSQKSATVKIVHWVVWALTSAMWSAASSFSSLTVLHVRLLWGLVLLAQAIRRLHWPRCSVYNLRDVVT
jgi:hypothetical protein